MLEQDFLISISHGEHQGSVSIVIGHIGRDVLVQQAELQKRADRADQSVLFFLASANFWEKHAKNC